jgi:hypothetical protein
LNKIFNEIILNKYYNEINEYFKKYEEIKEKEEFEKFEKLKIIIKVIILY